MPEALTFDIPEANEAGSDLGCAVRAFAAGSTGVHAIRRDAALEILRRPAGEGGLVWFDVISPGEAEAAFLRDELHFHPLAVEDCVRGRQRPKIDRYPGYFFVVVYQATVNRERNRMALNELHLFVGPTFIVTVRSKKIGEIGEVLARWRTNPRGFGDSGTLAHALLDAIVDGYFPVLDHFGDRVEALEEEMFSQTEEGRMSQVLALRRELAIFRRVAAPERDLFTSLLRRDLPFLRPELAPYFQDVHDHMMRVTEETDTLRELLSASVDAYLSATSNRLNQTMRLMAAWSIILMAMAWIAGIYGMNFTLMPELGWEYGYLWALGLMLVCAGGLIVYFRRRGWL